MSEIVSKIKYAMSLRTPQEEALSYLDAISSHCDYKKDSKEVVEAAASEYCEKQRKVKAGFDFPSFCFAMATGIGKTRLMGACIYHLYKTKGYKHFFILAPGNTIYDKLRKESNPNHPKYIFKGLEAKMGRPKVYDGENYDTYPVKFEQNFNIDTDKKSIEIFCSDRDCQFYRYKNDRIPIPVYLVDEEIYAKCPTIILSTVDKFARLPWDVNTNALFGRVDRKCSRDGYVAIGAEHGRHNKTASLPASTMVNIRPFLPPELIIQDELHLITGPLGTVYGAYETIIEDMCIHDGIKPKYVVSTATIKNAEAQTRCLYARKNTTQFPPNGFEIGDSFFIREISVDDDPFRKYVGVCAPGQSVKTALLRVYAIILQAAYTYSLQDEYKDVIDPYYSLVGYFNSIRELGGAVRLLQDDIPKRIYRIKNKYDLDKQRYLNHNVEITSRMSSYKIPEKLNQLETTCASKDCLDTAIATNMIAVGMDVDRLGLMVVTGQPKQNSEYIQATSRIGRAFPGLVVTLYNAYRPRDLSHYENFTGYHSQLYRFVEGTTATPFSARARDRVMHALIISAIRLNFPNMANNPDAAAIGSLTTEQLDSVKKLIIDRLNIIKPSARADAEEEIDRFIDWWKLQAAQTKPLRYYVVGTERYNRLMNPYDQPHDENEKATLRSMREVESSANMFYYTED